MQLNFTPTYNTNQLETEVSEEFKQYVQTIIDQMKAAFKNRQELKKNERTDTTC